jgi:hypothetical protein
VDADIDAVEGERESVLYCKSIRCGCVDMA